MKNELKKDFPYTCLFGIPFDYTTLNQNYTDDSNICNKIIDICNEYKKDNVARHIVTVNMDFISKCFSFFPSKQESEEQKHLLDILCSADIVVADGMPLVLMSTFLGTPLPQRVTGADLVPALARLSAYLRQQTNNIYEKKTLSHVTLLNKKSLKLYFLGGEKYVAQEAVVNLRKKYSNIDVVGIHSPAIKEIKFDKKDDMTHNTYDDNAQIIQRINTSNADILFLALGNPKQEFWFAQHRNEIKVPVTIGVGGALDFLANKTPRAPKWMQNIGFEWMWRMAHDPKRLLKRYSSNFVKLVSLGFPLILGHALSFLFAYTLHHRIIVLKRMNSNCTKNNKNIKLSETNDNITSIIENINNDRCIKITFTMPTIVSENSIHYIEDKVEYYLKKILNEKDSLYIIFDMQKSVYIELSTLAIFIRLFFSIKKDQERDKKLDTHSTTCKKTFKLIHLRRSMVFLLWCTGAYASLHDAIEK
ncbi:MAG: WecB/TagA/CpsF family glycosyltransferase [Pseudomonadota bacterium]